MKKGDIYWIALIIIEIMLTREIGYIRGKLNEKGKKAK